jgi:hypothetical protein
MVVLLLGSKGSSNHKNINFRGDKNYRFEVTKLQTFVSTNLSTFASITEGRSSFWLFSCNDNHSVPLYTALQITFQSHAMDKYQKLKNLVAFRNCLYQILIK